MNLKKPNFGITKNQIYCIFIVTNSFLIQIFVFLFRKTTKFKIKIICREYLYLGTGKIGLN